jgi:hypothetical protein
MRLTLLILFFLVTCSLCFSQTNSLMVFGGGSNTFFSPFETDDVVKNKSALSSEVGFIYTREVRKNVTLEAGFIFKNYSVEAFFNNIPLLFAFSTGSGMPIKTYQLPIRVILKTPEELIKKTRLYIGTGLRCNIAEREGYVRGRRGMVSSGQEYLSHIKRTKIDTRTGLLYEITGGVSYKISEKIILNIYTSSVFGTKTLITDEIWYDYSGNTNTVTRTSKGSFVSAGLGLSYMF